MVGKHNSIYAHLLRMSRNWHRNRNRPYMCTLKVTRRVTSPMTSSSFSLIRNVFPEDGDAHDPCGETSTLWGQRWKEELCEGPRADSDFSLSLSNEKKNGVMERKMVRLQRDFWDREVSQVSRGYEVSKFILIFKHKYKVDMQHTGISVRGVNGRTVEHICTFAGNSRLLPKAMN